MMLRCTIVLTAEPDGCAFDVTVPAMPGVLTWGATHEEALASAREAIELHLEGYVERGRPFPRDRRPQGKQSFTIEVRPPVGATRRSA
jgi:predicted RNase H-like HicB family nuclease